MDMKHVIFVDDEKIFHKVVKLKFRKEVAEGIIKIYHFYNGEECIEFLRSDPNAKKVEYVFSDISMPVMDGLTLVKLIKEEFSHLEVYMASALSLDDYKKRADEHDVVEFFAKPLNFKQIKEKIFN